MQDDLLAKDRELWSGGAEEYYNTLDADCLVAFTEMGGVSTRNQIADMVGKDQRWRDLELSLEGFLQPTEDIAILTYRASAVRGDQPYQARVSSGYVNRNGSWRMMFHQQTPLAG